MANLSIFELTTRWSFNLKHLPACVEINLFLVWRLSYSLVLLVFKKEICLFEAAGVV